MNFLLSPQCNQPQAGHLAAACWQGTPQLVTKVKPVCGSTRPRKELWRPHISHLFSNKYKSLNPCFTWKDPTNRTTTEPHSSNYTGQGWDIEVIFPWSPVVGRVLQKGSNSKFDGQKKNRNHEGDPQKESDPRKRPCSFTRQPLSYHLRPLQKRSITFMSGSWVDWNFHQI